MSLTFFTRLARLCPGLLVLHGIRVDAPQWRLAFDLRVDIHEVYLLEQTPRDGALVGRDAWLALSTMSY